MRKTRNEKKQNNGITLISLVITIIIMLILVGVSITLAVNGGLFEYAGNAVGDTKNEMKNEQDKVNSIIEDYIKPYTGEVIIGHDGERFSKIYEQTTKITQSEGDKTYTAWIPKGFAVGTYPEKISKISTGLVIRDENGNEFVWIPVEVVKEGENADSEKSISSFKRSAWENNARTDTLTSSSMPTSYWRWSDFKEPCASGYTNETAEYNDMLKSVYTYEGFYIGRYEAGTDTARTNTANGTSKMVVQRDKYPYIYVEWGASKKDYTSEITDTNSQNQGLGALALSKAMYANKKDVEVTSTLCYGVMWDAMLDFIIKDSSYSVTDSTTWGNYYNSTWEITRATAKWTRSPSDDKEWTPVGESGKTKTSYSGILLTTGASDDFSAKNIFDVAGNVAEITNENYSAFRICRGGFSGSKGDDSPASCRHQYGSGINESYGFRPALYITNNE